MSLMEPLKDDSNSNGARKQMEITSEEGDTSSQETEEMITQSVNADNQDTQEMGTPTMDFPSQPEECRPSENDLSSSIDIFANNEETNLDSADLRYRCYCKRDRSLHVTELQCSSCLRWFHEYCITATIRKCIPFMTNYNFVCKICSGGTTESFTKRTPNFTQMCCTTLANLMQQSNSDGASKTMFSRDRDIIPFIEKKWECLTTIPRRIKQTWHTTIVKTMLKDPDIFICEENAPPDSVLPELYPMFGLVTQDLRKIGPQWEMLKKVGPVATVDSSASSTVTTGLFGKGRSSRRKFPGDNYSPASTKKIKSDLIMPKLPQHGYPLEHPFNKDGYRYILAEPDPHAPFRQEFDESSDWAGKPIPGWLYRRLVPSAVLLAMHDRAPQLKISDDRLTVIGEKGYCMIRASHGVTSGTWYFECTMEDQPEGSHTRIGWSQELGNLQAPLGYDHFGYSWRSRKGTKFHQSKGYHYSNVGYSEGDTVGFLISLPQKSCLDLPAIFKDKPLVKFKSYLYYEEKDEVQQSIKSLKSLPGSKIMFYRNGKNQGVAWEDIYDGIYYPAISLYKSCAVKVNFGPRFRYPPRDVKFRPMSEAAHDSLVDQVMTDLLYFTENDGKLRLDNL